MCYCLKLSAQETLRGRILDHKNLKPVSGISVSVLGSPIVSVSDDKGRFSITTTGSKVKLRFSAEDYITEELLVSLPLKDPLEIYLKSKELLGGKPNAKIIEIEEVNLSTGYQKIPKERATGSFSSVSKSTLEQQVSTGIMERLPALVNGVSMSSGVRGENQLMVRGLSSLKGPLSPLIVVDNFPYEGDIKNINPNLVESVTVLKDAAAASIWGARAAIDLFPMLRPFALGLCIMFFPTLVLGTINAVLSPLVSGTHAILEHQVLDLKALQQKKDRLEYEAAVRNPETAYLVSDEVFDKKLEQLGWLPKDLIVMSGMYMERGMHQVGQKIKNWFRELLEILFQASALVIDTIRTFFLIVLSILGPIAFAISVWEGFQTTLTQWITRYISVYLWLPVADLLSSMLARIQSLIIEKDIEKLSDPNFIPDSSDTVYSIFMIIGIVGYFTIPTVSGWIIHASGAGNFIRNLNHTAQKTGNMASGGASSVAGSITGQLIK